MNANVSEQELLQGKLKLNRLFPHSDWMTILDTMLIRSNTKVKGMLAGKRRSAQFGSSLEFADYRPYVSGDDVRKIDWNLYGRSTKAYIRQYWDEQERSYSLFVDSSSSMKHFGDQDQNKWLFALRIAASIGYLALKGEDRLQLHLLGSDAVMKTVPAMYGKFATLQLIQALEEELVEHANSVHSPYDMLQAGSDLRLDMRALFSNVSIMPRRPGVCWVFSDGLYEEGVEELFQQLLARKQELVFVHIMNEQEVNPSLQGELKLIDIETASSREVAITPTILQRYKLGVEQFQIELKELCLKYGVAYYFLNASEPFMEQFLLMLSDQQTVSFKS